MKKIKLRNSEIEFIKKGFTDAQNTMIQFFRIG